MTWLIGPLVVTAFACTPSMDRRASSPESSTTTPATVSIPKSANLGAKPDTSPPPSTDAPTAPTTPSPNPPSMPAPGSPPGLTVDASRLPVAGVGSSVPRIGRASYAKGPGDGSAQFRTNCAFSHVRFDDPIVFPGRVGASHLHTFFGNTAVDGNSTPESVRTSGSSTCAGGTANRSAYWAPSVVDTATGVPVISDANPVDRGHFLQVYYKTGFDGVLPATVQNFPVGLRMIAGSATSTGPQPKVVTYGCEEGSAPTVSHVTSFPRCAPGQIFKMSVEFPQCWDGVNLDSPDHKSHMSYGAGWPDKGCPASHPVPLAQITQNYRYRVPAGGMATWRLSSDMYEGPAGYSGHADWMNGWDPAVFQRIIDNCYKGGFNCGMNLLGDGYELQ